MIVDLMIREDERYMKQAVDLAKAARAGGLRPFGCVIVDDEGTVLGLGMGTEEPHDPTRHSEIAAIKEACARLNGLLHGCTLYSTHEPCAMCCGAINHAKLSRVVWGTSRRQLPTLFRDRTYDAQALLGDTSVPAETVDGVLLGECAELFRHELMEIRQCSSS